MRFLDWLHIRTGVPVDTDGSYGAQCTDLVNDYLSEVWRIGPLAGNAIDFQHDLLPGWPWQPNTPKVRPPTGAIVVWNGPNAVIGTGPAGHTAVALLSDLSTLLTLDQNWPAGHSPQQVRHSYVAVAGWFHPPAPVLDRT